MDSGPPYKVNIHDVPLVAGLRAEEGWLNMQVQFLVNQDLAGASRILFGRTVFPPGSAHELHLHHHAEEFQCLVRGSGTAITDREQFPLSEGDVVFIAANRWHGFRNTSSAEAVMLWGWGGAGSLEAAGYEGWAPGADRS